jgi:Ca-activated chloride channel family protein
VAAVPAGGQALTAAWARARLRDLEDRYAAGTGDRQALEREIIATSLRFGVLCRFTAFVAVDVAEVVNERGEVHRVVQPVDAPHGWDLFAPGGEPARAIAFTAAAPAQAMAPMAARPAGLFRPGMTAQAPAGDTAVAPRRPLDLAAYRRRAAALADRVERAGWWDLTATAALAAEVSTLVADLRSVGAPEAVLAPLVELERELRAATAAGLRERAVRALREFAKGAPAGPAEGRTAFWKR